MELEHFLREVSEQLTAAAALGDERTREVAAALAGTARSSVRMAILDALAAATVEVTDALHAAGGDAQPAPAVSLQLTGDQVRFTVTTPPQLEEAEPVATRPEDGDATARISFRLPDSLKAEIDRAAGQAGLSVNSWLVRAATNALRPGTASAGGWHSSGGHRFTGWVTG
jgi:type 1 fimbria pilin